MACTFERNVGQSRRKEAHIFIHYFYVFEFLEVILAGGEVGGLHDDYHFADTLCTESYLDCPNMPAAMCSTHFLRYSIPNDSTGCTETLWRRQMNMIDIATKASFPS